MFLQFVTATLQLRNFPGDCAGEMFKHSNDASTHLGCEGKSKKALQSVFFL